MKIAEILATSYVHPDVDKILKKYEKQAKGRARMGYHPMMAYPYRVKEGWTAKISSRLGIQRQQSTEKIQVRRLL